MLHIRTQLAALVFLACTAILGLAMLVHERAQALEFRLRAGGLDRFALVRAPKDGKSYELPPGLGNSEDPALRLIYPASARAMAALPYIAQQGSLKSRPMSLRLAAGQREPAVFIMAADSLLTTLGLGQDERLRAALAAGRAVIAPEFAKHLGLHDGDVVRVISHTPEEISLLTRNMPAELRGSFRFEDEDFDIELAVLPLPLPQGFHGFESAVLISPAVDARHDIGGPMVMVRFTPEAVLADSLRDFEHFVATQVEAVPIGMRLQVVRLGSLFGGDDALNALRAWERRMQAWILGAALALCAGFLFLNWPVLLRELALRRTTGATTHKAIWRTAGPLLKVVAAVVIGTTALAAGAAALQGGMLGTTVVLLMTGMALVPSILLLACVGLAARRPLAGLLGASA